MRLDFSKQISLDLETQLEIDFLKIMRFQIKLTFWKQIGPDLEIGSPKYKRLKDEIKFLKEMELKSEIYISETDLSQVTD